MIFNRKLTQTRETNVVKCDKCKEKIKSRKEFCDKCERISLVGNLFGPIYDDDFKDIWFYIWYNGIKENGLEWYKKARDKLILKLDEKIEEQKKEEFEINKKLKNIVDRW